MEQNLFLCFYAITSDRQEYIRALFTMLNYQLSKYLRNLCIKHDPGPGAAWSA